MRVVVVEFEIDVLLPDTLVVVAIIGFNNVLFWALYRSYQP